MTNVGIYLLSSLSRHVLWPAIEGHPCFQHVLNWRLRTWPDILPIRCCSFISVLVTHRLMERPLSRRSTTAKLISYGKDGRICMSKGVAVGGVRCGERGGLWTLDMSACLSTHVNSHHDKHRDSGYPAVSRRPGLGFKKDAGKGVPDTTYLGTEHWFHLSHRRNNHLTIG